MLSMVNMTVAPRMLYESIVTNKIMGIDISNYTFQNNKNITIGQQEQRDIRMSDSRWRQDIPADKNHRIAIVIPVYNHGNSVVRIVERAMRCGYPVFVVDDGSTDGGAADLQAIPGIHLLRHTENRGKGEALITGFRAAQKVADWAVTMDADGQHNPEELIGLVEAIPQTGRPIILGVRKGMDDRNVPWTSRFGRVFSNFWVWMSGGTWLSDTQSGFRIYPLPEILHLGIRSGRYQFEVEALARAGWHKMPVVEVAVNVVYAAPGVRKTHFRPFVDFLRNSRVFTRLILTRIIRRLFVKKSGRNRQDVG